MMQDTQPITTLAQRFGTTPEPLQTAAALSENIVGGRYRLEEEIGQGAFAQVYSAYDMALHRRVAAKIYNLASGNGTRVSDAEVRLQATCQHPNIMPLHDAGSDSMLGAVYLIMPFYPGADLAATLNRFGPLTPKETQ